MHRGLTVLVICVASFISVQDAAAQRIAVQQPVVENFSVATTVSVPDRGSALLGGVGAARSGRFQSGPFPSGSALGPERQASSSSVQVFIHDFEAMDAALLSSSAPSRPSRLDPRITQRLKPRSPIAQKIDNEVAPSRDIAAEAERLAEQAEARGKAGVAKLHWQRAARYGSTRAAERLVAARTPN